VENADAVEHSNCPSCNYEKRGLRNLLEKKKKKKKETNSQKGGGGVEQKDRRKDKSPEKKKRCRGPREAKNGAASQCEGGSGVSGNTGTGKIKKVVCGTNGKKKGGGVGGGEKKKRVVAQSARGKKNAKVKKKKRPQGIAFDMPPGQLGGKRGQKVKKKSGLSGEGEKTGGFGGEWSENCTRPGKPKRNLSRECSNWGPPQGNTSHPKRKKTRIENRK